MRLNGWQRVRVIAAVVWVFGAGAWSLHTTALGAHNSSQKWGAACLDAARDKNGDVPPPGLKHCVDQSMAAFSLLQRSKWADAAVVAFAPLPMAWLVWRIILALGRWVALGFTGKRLD